MQNEVDEYIKKRNSSLLDKKSGGIFGAMDAIESGNQERQFQENLKQIEENKKKLEQLDGEFSDLSKESALANMSANDRAKTILGINSDDIKEVEEQTVQSFEDLLQVIESNYSRQLIDRKSVV